MNKYDNINITYLQEILLHAIISAWWIMLQLTA